MARKSRREARAERWTWFALIMVFIIISFDEQVTIPAYIVPIALGVILLFSGLYQYFREGWRVSPVVWIIGILLLVYAGFDIYMGGAPIDPILVGFIGTVVIILFGVLTNES